MKALILTPLIFFASGALAAPVAVNYTAEIESLHESHCVTYGTNGSCDEWVHTYKSSSDFYSGHSIAVGDNGIGAFGYDSDSPSGHLSDDGYQMSYLDALIDGTFISNDITFPSVELPWSNSGHLAIVNGRYDRDLIQFSYAFSNSSWFTRLVISLHDTTATQFDDFEIPTEISLEDFDVHIFRWAFVNRETHDQLQLRGTITSFEASSVPEINGSQLGIGLTLLLSLVLLYRERKGFQA